MLSGYFTLVEKASDCWLHFCAEMPILKRGENSVKLYYGGRKVQEEDMSKEQNFAAQQRFAEAAGGDYHAFYEVVAPDAVDHDPAPGQGRGPEGFEHFFKGFRTAFPDLHLTYDQIVADEDRIAVAYTLTGTHKGVYLGFPPTGKQVKVRGVQIAKFANGQLVERWGSSDQLGMLQQLGLAPTPTHGAPS